MAKPILVHFSYQDLSNLQGCLDQQVEALGDIHSVLKMMESHMEKISDGLEGLPLSEALGMTVFFRNLAAQLDQTGYVVGEINNQLMQRL